MIETAAAVLTASLLGSVHCAGMCGPLVAVYASRTSDRRDARWSHAAYNVGRLACYAVLGLLAGLAGRAIDLAAALGGIQRGAAIASGALIAAWGLAALLVAVGLPIPLHRASPRALHALFLRVHLRVQGQPAPTRALLLGLASALLPCGWLWAFVLTAAGSGSAVRGAAVMVVFWVGTLPLLVGFGSAIRAAAGPLRRHVPAFCAAVVMLVGLFVVVTRATDTAARPVPHGTSPAVRAVPVSSPCHDDR